MNCFLAVFLERSRVLHWDQTVRRNPLTQVSTRSSPILPSGTNHPQGGLRSHYLKSIGSLDRIIRERFKTAADCETRPPG